MFIDPLSCHSPQSNDAGLSDEQLITAFIDGVVNGVQSLQANKNLRVEPVFDSLQLLSNREGIIATVNLKQAPIRIEIRTNTEYFQQVHDNLFDLQYLPAQKGQAVDSYLYRYCEIPPGYELHCTIAKDLWRASWGRGFSARVGIPLDLIVWQPEASRREPWQALMGMDCDRGRLMVKMLGRSITVDSIDLIVWAKSNMAQARHRARTIHESYRGRRF